MLYKQIFNFTSEFKNEKAMIDALFKEPSIDKVLMLENIIYEQEAFKEILENEIDCSICFGYVMLDGH